MLSELTMFARYARALRGFFSETVTLEQAQAMLREGMAQREQTLIETLRRGVWETPHSPYRSLFRWAGVERGDAEHLITTDGVDEALRKLHHAGVYVTLDEFKGKHPIRRGSQELPVSAEDFDNPLLNAHFEGRTGGSRGVRRRLLVDLGMIARDAAAYLLMLDAAGTSGFKMSTWRTVPPNNAGIKKLLMGARNGTGFARWYSERPVQWTASEFKYAAFLTFTVAYGRWCGHDFPWPQHVTRAEVRKVVEWMATMTAAGTPVHLDCAASLAVRICSDALEANLSIAGCAFRVGSEPLTDARAATIRAAGVQLIGGYSTSETGPITVGCAAPHAPDESHVLLDKMAVIHAAPGDAAPGREDVLLLTTVQPSCPKILFNVDTGDSGVLERRECGCGLGRLGLHQMLSRIRSHEKLTADGILLPAFEVLRLVEEVLPAAFGGAPTDYQLVEDGRDGIPVVRIVVSPRRGEIRDADVITTVLDAIRAIGAGGRLTADVLAQSGTFSVLRREPFYSPIGKLHALHVITKE